MTERVNWTEVSVSRLVVPDLATPWIPAQQAPLSISFSRQGYWSGSPFPSPGDPPNPGIEPGCPALKADSLLTELQEKPWASMWILINSTVLCVSRFGYVQLFVTVFTVACQALLSMGSSRQEYWSGLPCPHPGNLPDPGIKPESLMSPALVGGFFMTSTSWGALPLTG